MNKNRSARRAVGAGLAALGIGTISMLGMSAPAGADIVGVTVTPGERTASMTDLVLPPVVSSHEVWNTVGTATLLADDSSGSGLGWTVTVQASNFTGPDLIPASSLNVFYTSPVVSRAGQPVDALGGPFVPGVETFGALDLPRPLMVAAPGSGMGSYSQDVGLLLEVPADTLAGEYSTTLTVSITAAP